ncbi:EAL domain-containing protein [Phyllobacterium leguminum]|uniref:cyclic-guanylate-specific phosphodiesterase n=1 Tax=Phyllobacterium leguminum TaxID=314237 RepID=A0A318T6I6_9HYPH|nr:EAL domain-containing protein [Phyllobacterium leguminum]PYE90618.1 sensor c-di-GMP phosphodiesterase-like protein [Phyllobacterium leguminum]
MIDRLRPIFRTSPILLVVLLTALVGGAFGHVLGNRMRMSSDKEDMTTYSNQLMTHATSVINAAKGALNIANASPYPFCSAAEIELLRNILFETRNVKDIGRIRDGNVVCSTILGKPDRHVRMPRAAPIELADGLKVYPDVPLAVSNTQATILSKANSDAVIDPRAFDTLQEAPYRFAVFYGDIDAQRFGQIFGDKGAGSPQSSGPEAWDLQDGILRRDSCDSRSGLCIAVWADADALGTDNYVNAITALGAALGALGGLGWIDFRRRDQSLMARLSRALAREELTLVYQPVVDVADERIVAAEALIRWWSNGDFIPPDVFIALAEQRGMAGQITRYVLDHVIQEMGETLRLHRDFRITINVTASDLNDPKFLAAIEEGLHYAQIEPEQIGIELTERSAADSHAAIEGIARLRARGHSVYIDDFGTGYSSLSYLGELKVDALKMDRAFTRTVGTDAVTVSIVPQIIDMATKHKLAIVAEGIETEAQAAYFRGLPVRILGQGWFYGRPVSAPRLIKRLEQQDGIIALRKHRKKNRPGTQAG